MKFRTPYLLFLGDAPDALAAKTAQGILDWRPALCLGQLRLSGCNVDLGIKAMSVKAAADAGAGTLVVGLANSGGKLDPRHVPTLTAAAAQGLDLASGLHQRLGDVPEIAEAARRHGIRLWDVRYADRRFDPGTGEKRSGQRLLTVGTDCSCGKKYTALALERDLRAKGVKADFRATGQTGILIAGEGVAIDAVVSDFMSGAAEWLSPANEPGHWDVIEGQGSLFHPAFAGVSLGLLHGSQPDAFVVCHAPGRSTMRGVACALPTIDEVKTATIRHGRLTNPAIQCVGIALNTAGLAETAAARLLRETAGAYPDLPVVDPLRQGTWPILQRLETIASKKA